MTDKQIMQKIDEAMKFGRKQALEEVRVEIDEQYDRVYPHNISCADGLEMALGIIDKHLQEGRNENNSCIQ